MLANLNQAMDYIEEHLTEEVSFDELAKKTGISVYHFKRTFSFIAGMSLASLNSLSILILKEDNQWMLN